MIYLVVSDWDENNIVIAEAYAEDEARAIELRDIMVSEGNANAFYVLNPGGRSPFKVVDPVAQTVTFDQEGYDQRNARSVWDSFRTERNTLLTESDWTQSPDSPLADEAKAEWATYRQELRDLPENVEDPANPSWPDEPQ